ncbi:MAG TPA: non-homologous end-joining DNA ligase [Terriglobales bacterium]|nr:non-homologous end-joining DNA ligase [Terriglobales bacterium]
MGNYEDRAIGKRAVRRPPWRGTPSQQRDAAKRRREGRRLLGPLPLAAGAASGQPEIDGIRVPLTNLRKVFFPGDGYTKRDLLDYTHDVAEFLLPHLLNRPYTLKRYPNGIEGDYFFQKEAGLQLPDWIPYTKLPSKGERSSINFVLCNDCPTLLYLVNLGCIDHNVWMSRATTPDEPDFILLDLDPGPRARFEDVVRVAREVRRVLERFEILGLPKTSGATGMHVFIPLAAGCTFEQSSTFANLIFKHVAQALPDLVTEVWPVARRPQDRVYLDYRQNAKGKTVPPPYSPRPRPGAPVSAPLRWSDVKSGLDPTQFTIRTMRQRLERHGDLFAAALPASGQGQPIAAMLEHMAR